MITAQPATYKAAHMITSPGGSSTFPLWVIPGVLLVRVPRFTCTNDQCHRRIFQTHLSCADAGAKVTHRVTRWILQRLAVDRMSVSATAKALGVGWDLVNTIAAHAAKNMVYADPDHFGRDPRIGG